jgi:GNAT superfamily N-acetyltransferase
LVSYDKRLLNLSEFLHLGMGLNAQHASGMEYLRLVTELLQRIRLASPDGGVWEAADLQWAWRHDQHPDPATATFWSDDSDRIVAGSVITNRGGCDLLVGREDEELLPMMWAATLETLDRLAPSAVEMSVRDDDAMMLGLVTAAGFVRGDEMAVSCLLDATDRPRVSELASGYRLLSRADRPDVPHHMIKRNGEHVAERLLECSLYDPALDLFVESPDGSVAAYGLFWPDPVTGVGLVEPMRTEDEHQGLGLARHVLTAGVERLAAAGCAHMKITYMDDNAVSKHVYLSSGFLPINYCHDYRRPGLEP